MADGDDDELEDRPQDIPAQQSAVDPKDAKKREARKKVQAREDADFVRRMLADPAGRRFVWGLLRDAGTFEEKYGFGPTGFPHPEATWRYAGQKDFGLQLYLRLAALDRAGVLSLHDEFDPRFQDMPKV